jgi:hypothetical protein
MQSARLTDLLRRAASMPPHRTFAKAAGVARRHAKALWQRRSDAVRGSHSPLVSGLPWRNRLTIAAADIPADLHEPLRLIGDQYCRHRFDLLGSGWVEVRYGMSCRGFAGRVYSAHAGVAADRNGTWLTGHVNASNLDRARALWQRIGDDNYQPIDWQLDFRSGYRWRAKAHVSELNIPVDTGADIKVPWELGRLQHLPQLALCAIVARSGAAGFAPADVYLRELGHQLLDFLALNPPRFGVNWMCPMDVGIRVANMLLAIDLLAGAGLRPEQTLVDIVLCAARNHAEHVADHLEWAERGRSNHYLANLVGLLWAAIHLPAEATTDAWLAFGAGELLREIDQQFGADGGNYEGSTNYHRLSGEIALFGVALLAGLGDDELTRIDRAQSDAIRLCVRWRGGALPRHSSGGGGTIVSPRLLEKLHNAARLTRAATRPDGHVVQIGDTDSGRLFKMTPLGRIARLGEEHRFEEDVLDHRAFAEGVEALFGDSGKTRTLDAIAVRRLCGDRNFPRPVARAAADHGNLAAAIAAIATLPEACRRVRHIAFDAPVGPAAWRRAAFADFGLYCFSTDRAFIAFRCAPQPPAAAPLGHRHDDNLGIEYVIGTARRIDPGSFCYTPSAQLRERYRGAAVHDVVRAADWDLATPGHDLFDARHAAWAQCDAWGPDGVAGRIAAPQGTLLRALRITEHGLEIWDGVHPPDRLRAVAPQGDIADGYGWLVARERPPPSGGCIGDE